MYAEIIPIDPQITRDDPSLARALTRATLESLLVRLDDDVARTDDPETAEMREEVLIALHRLDMEEVTA